MATTSTNGSTDFNVRNEGTIVVFYPLTDLAKKWWDEHVNDGPVIGGSDRAHVVEHSFARDIIEDLVNHGFQLKAVR